MEEAPHTGSKPRGWEMSKRWAAVVGMLILALSYGIPNVDTASAASSTQGVTSTTIRIGVPYVEVAAVKAVGVNLNWGNVTHDYQAIINNINSTGGINGRKLVPFIVAVDPTEAAPAATTCTQLTQDDHVFTVIAPLMPTCYLQAGVPVVAAVLSGSVPSGLAQNFSLVPPASAYDPLQLSVFNKMGAFKNKKVGVFAGVTTDEAEMKVVLTDLAKLHVDVVSTAVDSATQGDLPAENGQVAVIAQRFQAAGVNEVVAVGYGSSIWPEALTSIQSSFNPPYIATNSGDLTGAIQGNHQPKYLNNVLTSTPATAAASVWKNAAIQRCLHIVKKAYPSDQIHPYAPGLPGSETTYVGVEQACTDLSLFTAIAKAAGRHLTVSTFVHAGFGLRNVVIAGSNTPISFAPGRPYALGPVNVLRYDAANNTMVVVSTKSAT